MFDSAIDPDQEEALTYGIFTDASQDLNNFRLFYPHSSFLYEKLRKTR